jgi:hypothetical protein
MKDEIEQIVGKVESGHLEPKEALDELLILFSVSKCYTEKDMDNAYDKGFNDGNKRDLTGSLIEVL